MQELAQQLAHIATVSTNNFQTIRQAIMHQDVWFEAIKTAIVDAGIEVDWEKLTADASVKVQQQLAEAEQASKSPTPAPAPLIIPATSMSDSSVDIVFGGDHVAEPSFVDVTGA